jgi:integrase
MSVTARRRRRQRGRIEELPSGSLRVSVYAGVDPLTKRRIYLKETVPDGPKAHAEAERALTRLLNQVDEKRHPRTSTTVGRLLDRYLELLDVSAHTKRDYESIINKHIKPLLGQLKVSRFADHSSAEILDSFYAELRRCRDHCDGTPFVQHRTAQDHDCDPHPKTACRPANPGCRHCRRTCKPHVCKPLGKSAIRQSHWILSGAFRRAVRWGWIAVNPTERTESPDLPTPNPTPPAVDEAARLIEEAARRDPDWGTFVWVAATVGARRGEMCALRWEDLDLERKVVHLHRAIGFDNDGTWIEKDTKTHQHRRVVLDDQTVDLLREHLDRHQQNAQALGIDLPTTAYVFTQDPEGRTFLLPDSATQRYSRMAEQLGIATTLHKLRHYSATELINAGVNIRTVAGRLGHGGGGATTLRIYTAWLSEADQRAASTLAGRMPARKRATNTAGTTATEPPTRTTAEANDPYLKIAGDLRGAIHSGALRAGDELPTLKDLCARYKVASATAHRAVQLLKDEGLVEASRGRRTTVASRTHPI